MNWLLIGRCTSSAAMEVGYSCGTGVRSCHLSLESYFEIIFLEVQLLLGFSGDAVEIIDNHWESCGDRPSPGQSLLHWAEGVRLPCLRERVSSAIK